MENIIKLQDYVKTFFEQELLDFYTFDIWKELLILLRQDQNSAEAHKIFERYGQALTVRRMFVDVRASDDQWAPTLSIELDWKTQGSIVGFRAIIVKNEVMYVQVLDMLGASQSFGSKHDFVKEFDKTVVMMKALRG